MLVLLFMAVRSVSLEVAQPRLDAKDTANFVMVLAAHLREPRPRSLDLLFPLTLEHALVGETNFHVFHRDIRFTLSV